MADLKISGLHKYYGALHAVRGIDLEVPSGEFTVLVGPSGCGKSTLLRTIAGLEDTNDGSIEIGGKNVTHVRPRDRDIAMVFQNYALYPYMNVYENIAFGLRARKFAQAAIDKRVKQAAEMLGIGALLERLPRQLSGGQRQRVAIGRAIVRDARLFLFDEPLSNLDAQLRDDMRSEIKRLHQEIGRTMIYVTHDQIEAMTLADRIVLLRDGKIEQVGPPLALYEQPATRFVAGFLGSPKMNFIPARILSDAAGGELLDLGQNVLVKLPFTPPSLSEVLLGIRPQHIDIATGAGGRNRAKVASMIELVQPTGARMLITCPVGSTSVVAEVDPHSGCKPGERVELEFDMNHAVLIDPATDRVVSPRKAA
ncbi:MAG: ABC transporter ATP-binding protein [Hyphomicrobiales bacterium]